ncbi:MAG: glycosyltransferase family 2 protein [Ruminococcaceae bacterium]|nr:glycosyltransferase family 2 protein [Oscillospiraceae bacterium]
MAYNSIPGVPEFFVFNEGKRKTKYCLMIPIINENERIIRELKRAKKAGIPQICDIIILDGGSTDGSIERMMDLNLGVNSILIKTGKGHQGAQYRMGFHYAISKGYEGFVTIDGNDKDSIEDTNRFIDKLDEGYDFVQGSRFIKGGTEKHTPLIRNLAVRLIHAPIISLAAKKRYTDTTNAFRAYSKRYIVNDKVNIFRDVFDRYELLAYLSIRVTQIGLTATEIPVSRIYPKNEKTPTKISPIKGNLNLLIVLLKAVFGKYNPK